jgi:hypothetical protein
MPFNGVTSSWTALSSIVALRREKNSVQLTLRSSYGTEISINTGTLCINISPNVVFEIQIYNM